MKWRGSLMGAVLILLVSVSIVHARQYDPSTGRFLQEDAFLSTNVYNYGMNNPVANTDPFGLWINVGKNGDEYSIDITIRVDPVAANEDASFELIPFAAGWFAMSAKYDIERTWSVSGKINVNADIVVAGHSSEYSDYHVLKIRDYGSECMGKAVFIDYHDLGKGHIFSHEFTHWLGAQDTYSKVFGRESIMPIISSPGTCGMNCLNNNSLYLLDRIVGNEYDPNRFFYRNPAVEQILNGM
jgi:hypothetical protein